MYGKFQDHLKAQLNQIREAGLYKEERIIESAQAAAIEVGGKEVLNFCANNYLGLANNPRLIAAAKEAMDKRGYGMSSVRFICGTATPSTMLQSSTAYASAKPCAIATPMPIWKSSKSASNRRRPNASASSAPMVCSQWTAMWPRWIRFATWPSVTTRW